MAPPMPDPSPADPLDKTKMSFFSHLEELRLALFKSLLALAIGIWLVSRRLKLERG